MIRPLFLLASLLFSTQVMCANYCRLPYNLGYSERGWQHFYPKTDASNIWVSEFSSSKFINTFKGKVDFYEYTKALIKNNDYSDIVDKNIKALAYNLFDKNIIKQAEYNGLLQSLSKHSERRELISKLLKNADIEKDALKLLEIRLQNSKLNKSHLELFGQKIKDGPKNINSSEKLLNYVDYLNTRKTSELEVYIDKISDLLESKTKQIRSFERSLKKVDKYKTKISNELQKKFLKENKGKDLNSSQMKRLSQEIESKTKTYAKTLKSCGNREFLSTHAKNSEKKFTRFLLGFSTVTTAGGFALANYEDPIDQEWVKKLGYEVVFGAFFAWLGAKVSINPHFSFMKKTTVNMGVSAGFDVFDSFLYDTIITNEDDKSENLSADKKKELEKLFKEFEERNLDQKFLDRYKEYFYVDQETKNIELIFESELEKEERSDEIIEAISSKIEEGKMSDWLGDNAGVQRFAFHRAWDVISIPKTVLLGVAMYKVFCMSKVNVAKAYKVAAGMIIADEVFESFLYYKVRKSTIDQ